MGRIIKNEKEVLNRAFIDETQSLRTTAVLLDPLTPPISETTTLQVYESDIDLDNSDTTGWVGNLLDLFGSPFSNSLVNATTDNPKILKVAFKRSIQSIQIALGENNGGSWSNLKIVLEGSGGAERDLIDKSGDNTPLVSDNVLFDNEIYNSVRFEFYTTNTISLSNIVILKAVYSTNQIVAKTVTGEFLNVSSDEGGALNVNDTSSGLAIAEGNVPFKTFIHKFGEAAEVDTADGFVDIWDGVNSNLPGGKITTYTYSTTADIDSLSSSDLNDNQLIEVTGLDIDYNEVIQTIQLTNQTTVLLPIPLVRAYRMKNIGSVDIQGAVYLYTNGAATTAGVPNDPTTVRAIINDGNNQTLMSIYTVPAGKMAYMRDWYSSISRDRTTSCTIKLFARPFGQVFQLKHVAAISSVGTSYIQHQYQEPEVFGEKTDIIMKTDTTTNDTGVSSGFDIVLTDNIP